MGLDIDYWCKTTLKPGVGRSDLWSKQIVVDHFVITFVCDQTISRSLVSKKGYQNQYQEGFINIKTISLGLRLLRIVSLLIKFETCLLFVITFERDNKVLCTVTRKTVLLEFPLLKTEGSNRVSQQICPEVLHVYTSWPLLQSFTRDCLVYPPFRQKTVLWDYTQFLEKNVERRA